MYILCSRKYGEPKLKKPSYLNNKTLLGSVDFISKKCKNKVWFYENKYYILFRDWFSDLISLDKAKELGIIDEIKSKFVYRDNFGSIVLRNEAIIVIEPKDWVKPYQLKKDNLVVSFAKMLNQDETTFMIYQYENLFEQFIKLIGEKPFVKENNFW